MLNRGFTVYPDELGLQLNLKSDSRLGDSIDSKTWLKIMLLENILFYKFLPHMYMQSIVTYGYMPNKELY